MHHNHKDPTCADIGKRVRKSSNHSFNSNKSFNDKHGLNYPLGVYHSDISSLGGVEPHPTLALTLSGTHQGHHNGYTCSAHCTLDDTIHHNEYLHLLPSALG